MTDDTVKLLETKLHEILAVGTDAQNAAKVIQEETRATFTKKDSHFRGQTQKTTFFDELRSGENTTSSSEVVTTIAAKLDHTAGVLGRHYDLLVQQEEANTRAFADVIVGGEVLLKNVPASALLGMEHRLKDFGETLKKIPTLDPSIRWEADPSAGKGIYRSPVIDTFRSEKVFENNTKAEATKEHPAQVETYTRDKNVAKIETTQFSGMITPAAKSDLIRRCMEVLAAVKTARQRANCVQVKKVKVAKPIFDYILGRT